MTILKRVKLAALHLGEGLGVSRLLLESNWRRQRLLILCYHGISLADEHEWDSSLFMPEALVRQRFEALRSHRSAVLPLGEALERLREGCLPPRAVTITFDDGTYDFVARAMPLVREFGYPVTLYVATFYSAFNRPIYDLAVSYVLWKARGRMLDFPEVLPRPVLLDAAGRADATGAFRAHAHVRDLSAEQKDDVLDRVAGACAVDLAAIRRARILHVMTPEEIGAVAREGVDVQLHTHRHRVYDDRRRFDEGLDDNRQHLAPVVAGVREHFCYPGGVHLPEFLPWLEQKGIRSATTCEPGLASRRTNSLLLPRLIDTSTLTPMEFSAWVSGLASFLPRRRHERPDWMLVRSLAGGTRHSGLTTHN
jgi:peptidoglycan/xylan/chitin deacetylase (PgdA/CDA1 family)